jgi:hypothetical protein
VSPPARQRQPLESFRCLDDCRDKKDARIGAAVERWKKAEFARAAREEGRDEADLLREIVDAYLKSRR